MRRDIAFPTLPRQDADRLAAYGTVVESSAGEVLFEPGEHAYDFIVPAGITRPGRPRCSSPSAPPRSTC